MPSHHNYTSFFLSQLILINLLFNLYICSPGTFYLPVRLPGKLHSVLILCPCHSGFADESFINLLSYVALSGMTILFSYYVLSLPSILLMIVRTTWDISAAASEVEVVCFLNMSGSRMVGFHSLASDKDGSSTLTVCVLS